MVNRNAFSAKAALAIAVVAAAALFALPAKASTYFDFSYYGTGVSGSGTFTATGTAGTAGNYTLTGVTGIANGLAIAGLSAYANSDNMVFSPSTPSVDEGGISFTTSGDTWNIYSLNGNYYITSVNLFNDPNGVGVVGGNFGTELTSLSIEDPLPSTPLPSSWTMLIAGCLGLGLLAYRGSKKGSAAVAAA